MPGMIVETIAMTYAKSRKGAFVRSTNQAIVKAIKKANTVLPVA